MKKIALITGASSGFGAAIAKSLAKEGMDLILTARRVDRLNALAEQLTKEYGIRVLDFQIDVTNKEQVDQQLKHLPEEWRDIDILVNNAGLALGLEPVAEGNILDWERMMNTNVLGLLYMTRQILPSMVARKSGYIVNISSTAGVWSYANGAVYAASKHAVNALGEALRQELVASNVRLTTICPGMAETEFSNVRFKGDDAKADDVYQGIKALSAEDIADAVRYCVSCPEHVNISELVIQPTAQAGPLVVHRELN